MSVRTPSPRVLLAEDDELLGDALSTHLDKVGYTVEVAANGAVADYLLSRQTFDIAVLDIGLPMLDGLEVLRRLRARDADLPVLLLTARDALDDRMQGFASGADDYVIKPFDMPELLARLQALLRRRRPGRSVAQDSWHGLRLDHDRRQAFVGGTALDLSGREWALLALLMAERDRVVSKAEIAKAWGADGAELGPGNTIEVYIHRLRRKIDGSGLVIRTVRGLGYLLEARSDGEP